MKVIVAGSRTVTEFWRVDEAIEDSPWVMAIQEVVSGCARGADTLAIEWANSAGVDVARFAAEWEKLGPSAGPIRNDLMAKYADALVAVWDGKSRGTHHMIESAVKHGLPVYIHPAGP